MISNPWVLLFNFQNFDLININKQFQHTDYANLHRNALLKNHIWQFQNELNCFTFKTQNFGQDVTRLRGRGYEFYSQNEAKKLVTHWRLYRIVRFGWIFAYVLSNSWGWSEYSLSLWILQLGLRVTLTILMLSQCG